MKKYYAYFIYNDEEYVIRFKIKGSLVLDTRNRCFIDKNWYVRTVADVICMAAVGHHPLNDRSFNPICCLLTHNQFMDYRIRGIKRWNPKNEIIFWD